MRVNRRRFLSLLGLAAVAPVAIKLVKLVPATPIADAANVNQLSGMAIISRQWAAEAQFVSIIDANAQARRQLAEYFARHFDEIVFKSMHIEAGYITIGANQ